MPKSAMLGSAKKSESRPKKKRLNEKNKRERELKKCLKQKMRRSLVSINSNVLIISI
jgi:hypothetical protein